MQFAVRDGEVFVIEANPRASRTVPFVAKATGMPLVEAACRVALGDRIADLGLRETVPTVVSVKEAVLPFARFPGADALLGPEMRATGEVMGIGPDFATAFAKASRAAGQPLPGPRPDRQSAVAITVNDRDKPAATLLAQRFHDIGFRIYATGGTARAIRRLGTPVDEVVEGARARCRHDPRADHERRRRPGRQHAARARRPRRRLRDPPGLHAGQGAVHHDAVGRERRRAGDGAGLEGRPEAAAGAPPGSGGRRARAGVTASPSPLTVRGCVAVGSYTVIELDGDVDVGPPGTFAMVRDPAGSGVPAAPGRAVPAARRHAGVPGRPGVLRRRAGARARRSTCCRRSARGFDLAGARAETTLLVGGGIGATVFFGIAAALGGPVRVVAGFREASQAAMLELIAPAGFREAALAPRLVTELVDLTGIELVLASGPGAMVRAVAALAAAAGIPCQVALEAPMACGFGACYGCAVELDGTWQRLCIEGPVVAAERLS